MSGRVRKTMVIGVALVALILAGAAGAIVRSTVFTITPGNYARLSGTNLYCSNRLTNDKARALVCGLYGGPGKPKVPATYFFTTNQRGVTVERVTNTSKGYETTRGFANPQTPGP
jgi:hypothetical protein